MKTPLLLILLATCLYYYFQNNPAPRKALAENNRSAELATRPHRVSSSEGIVIAALPPYSERWKMGPYAQTDLKTGPNAQVDFAPFAPSEMANWNHSSGYTIISGVSLRR